MKRLQEYIFENIINIFESTSDFILLKTFEDAKTWFENVGWVVNDDDSKLKEKMKISLNDILTIYDIADEHNKIAPLVGNYKSKRVFAMRRWIDNYIDEWSKISKNSNITDDWFWTPIKGIYGGPHNTNLKEDGSFQPTAEDMESVISFAYNHLSNEEYDDYENMNYVCNSSKNKPNQKVENLLNYYQDEKRFMDGCANALIKFINNKSLKFHKLLTNGETCTELWKKLGTYEEANEKVNNTPKTDIISSDNQYKISLKKAHGSQLMSGAYCESKATIMSIAKDTLNNDDFKLLEDLLSIDKKWTKLSGNNKGIAKQKLSGSDEIKKIISDSENAANNVNKTLSELLDKNKKFKSALLYEAMTGEIKFGNKSLLSANYVFVWSTKESENKLYTVKDYLTYLLSNKCKLKIEVSWKTGGSTSYQTLRIVTN